MKASLSLKHSNKVLSLIVETGDGLVDNLARSVHIGSNHSIHKNVWNKTTTHKGSIQIVF